MDGKQLLTGNLTRAVAATPNVLAGCAAALASLALLNPLPAILWGVGSTAWVLGAVKNGRYTQTILDDERAARVAKESRERNLIYRSIYHFSTQAPIVGWTHTGQLPDYLRQYRALEEVRDRIARVANQRGEVGHDVEFGIMWKLDQMLTAFLRLVDSRLHYVQILTNHHVKPIPASTDLVRIEQRAPTQGPWRRFLELFVNVERRDPALDDSFIAAPPVVFETDAPALAELPALDLDCVARETTEQLERIRGLLEAEPAARQVRRSHIALLEKRLELARDCRKQDQRITAQLESFSDAYGLILEQMRATQFDAGEVVEYMDQLADEVRQTEQDAELVSPRANKLFDNFGALVSASS